MTDTARVLVIEDDDAIRLAVTAALRSEGWRVESVPDGSSLDSVLEQFRPDLVVLDWMLPGRDGPTLAPRIRSRSQAGIVMLTARDAVDDRLRGFGAGADDYIVKPFAMAELVARVQAVLRRLGRGGGVVEVDDLVIDEPAAVAMRAGRRLDLTATEFRLLAFLAGHAGQTLSTTQILTQVWGYDDYADNLVQVHISALRRKSEPLGPRLIHTVRGLGYVLRAPDSTAP